MTMTPATRSLLRLAGWVVAILAGLAALLVLALGFLPPGLAKTFAEQRLSASYGAPVTIGAITRDQTFSYTPDLAIRDIRIQQPGWAGPGDFMRIRAVKLRLSIFGALFGHSAPEKLTIEGADIALVRLADGTSNWGRKRKPGDPPPKDSTPKLKDLIVTDSRVSLRDARRGLVLAGPVSVDAARGLRVTALGTFQQTPTTLELRGGRVTGIDPAAAYPVEVHLASPALTLDAKGSMDGVFDTRHFAATMTARAPSLKNLDRLIEAGLFGTQPIALIAKIRHEGRDWYVDSIGGGIGRSRFVGRATVKKHDVGDVQRTVIDATIRASQFDFDDLSDAQGQAQAARSRAAAGPRVLPPTRINLSKLWKTDGRIAFRIDRILAGKGTVFRTLNGVIELDHKVLTVRNVNATLADGRMGGTITVNHREGRPKLNVDLRLEGLTLDALIGSPGQISGPVRGRILLDGEGDTVREALGNASGRAAMVATSGSLKATVADVLGQDLGGTIGHAIFHPSERVPLRCLVANFSGRGGVLSPSPLAIDTGSSIGRGSGRINLRDETIALSLSGAKRGGAALRIVDPIGVGGTLTKPEVSIAGSAAPGAPTTGGIFKAVGRSLKDALGLGSREAPPRLAFVPLDCGKMAAAALR
ncbi:AsmA family protein [Sphingomonas immobilis]|uniref:AsmA family protein n=1 Tax=Sphingomonas immobilis TaxID=3063997 RepID=A0ABT9A1E1_9SPHN|nr:AsmA family protein [Sphingomonas sp. CA1-15]MDO7843644.1 AsmA family protein [Sphingomonas sp. CA1-15]